MESTPEINDKLLEWYNSFTFGKLTYKNGKDFISRIKPKEPQPKKRVKKS